MTPEMQYMMTRKSAGVAMGCELLGLFFGIPGCGSLYAGRWEGMSLALVYIPIQIWNIMMMVIFIGFILFPITFAMFLLPGMLLAKYCVDKHNNELATKLGVMAL